MKDFGRSTNSNYFTNAPSGWLLLKSIFPSLQSRLHHQWMQVGQRLGLAHPAGAPKAAPKAAPRGRATAVAVTAVPAGMEGVIEEDQKNGA